jgi:hypothetical protein
LPENNYNQQIDNSLTKGRVMDKTREEVREFIDLQMDHETPASKEKLDRTCGCWHYGKCEIEELLDFIYGERERPVKKAGKTVEAKKPIIHKGSRTNEQT